LYSYYSLLQKGAPWEAGPGKIKIEKYSILGP